MRNVFILLCALLLAGCTGEAGELHCRVRVCLCVPEAASVQQMQGTVRLKNINSRETYSTSLFEGGTATIEILRGAYAIDAEGTVRFTDAGGDEQSSSFRASRAYEDLTDDTEISLDVSFL